MIPPEFISYSIYVLAVILIIILVLVIRNEMRMKKFLRASGTTNLQGTLESIEKELAKLQAFKASSEERLQTAEQELNKSIQNIGIIRFNPFKGTSGSNQSFAAAFLRKNGDGVVLSSIYSREHVSIFGKKVAGKESEYGLSDEEKRAIEVAEEES